MMEAAVMADHFDSINKLPEGVAGVPNWRCVPGYQVQPPFKPLCWGVESLCQMGWGSFSVHIIITEAPNCHHILQYFHREVKITVLKKFVQF